MVTSPWQHVSNFLNIGRCSVKRDKTKSTTQAAYKTPHPPAAYKTPHTPAAYKTPHTRSVRDAATTREANIQIYRYTGRRQEPNGSYWCNPRGVSTGDRSNRPTRRDFQGRFPQGPSVFAVEVILSDAMKPERHKGHIGFICNRLVDRELSYTIRVDGQLCNNRPSTTAIRKNIVTVR